MALVGLGDLYGKGLRFKIRLSVGFVCWLYLVWGCCPSVVAFGVVLWHANGVGGIGMLVMELEVHVGHRLAVASAAWWWVGPCWLILGQVSAWGVVSPQISSSMAGSVLVGGAAGPMLIPWGYFNLGILWMFRSPLCLCSRSMAPYIG